MNKKALTVVTLLGVLCSCGVFVFLLNIVWKQYWPWREGRIIHTLEGHTDVVQSARYSPDGDTIVTGSNDNTAKIWDARTGKEIATLSGHSDWVTSAVYNPTGDRIATSSRDSTIKIWDAISRQEILTLNGHTDAVWNIAYSPNGLTIASISDGTIKIWDTQTGHEILTQKNQNPMNGITYSPDGSEIAVAYRGEALEEIVAKIWNVQTGQEKISLIGHKRFIEAVEKWNPEMYQEMMLNPGVLWGHVKSVVYNPAGTRIVTAGDDGKAIIWDAQTGNALKVLEGHKYSLIDASYHPNGCCVLTAGLDKQLKIWDAETGQELVTISMLYVDDATSAQYSPDGQYVVTAHRDSKARVWDVNRSK